MNSNITRNDLHLLFPIPCNSVVETTGVADGTIIKFKTFYLKIYDVKEFGKFNISGYLYNIDTPVFSKIITMYEIRKFASTFTKDNYLHQFRNYKK